ncbi:type II TA system antitoxin MqsA family protein [Bacillus stercoris]|uniref:type II TA system antitoxin MqsA family protein n=1 Tax=Bacillus stercoris TaxID=2054641 RepID=UPI0021FDB3D5|nr:type II toxin-antitoxin system [Bacillus phage PK-3]
MIHFCPECLESRSFKEDYEKEIFNIKGEKIEIFSRFLICNVCGESILDPENLDENFIKAYSKYKRLKGYLQSYEIIELRKILGVSQAELANMLGCSQETIHRYETGAIQSEAHNEELLRIKNDLKFFKVIDKNDTYCAYKGILIKENDQNLVLRMRVGRSPLDLIYNKSQVKEIIN